VANLWDFAPAIKSQYPVAYATSWVTTYPDSRKHILQLVDELDECWVVDVYTVAPIVSINHLNRPCRRRVLRAWVVAGRGHGEQRLDLQGRYVRGFRSTMSVSHRDAEEEQARRQARNER
jgi:hypothetical protein